MMIDKRYLKKKMLDYLLGGLLLYVAVALFLFVIQRSFMYFPDPDRQDPARFGVPDIEVVNVVTEDGLELEGWYQPPADGKPVIVFFHGNASHMGQSAWKTEAYRKRGYGALLMAYRGYAGNPGKPTEEGLYKDADAFLSWLIQSHNKNYQDIVIYGESLGSGVAVQLASTTYRDVGGGDSRGSLYQLH